MKLFIVTCLKDYQKTITEIFEKSQIKVFSVSSIIGYKEDHKENLLDDWFATGEEEFDSIVLFSFTEDSKAVTALDFVKEYNEKEASKFPIRAFILPVEQSSY